MTYFKSIAFSVIVALTCVSFPVSAEQGLTESVSIADQVTDTVNINSADAELLAMSLKGVGEKRAQAIVNYRKLNGPFTDVNQLEEIKGISSRIIEQNLDKIRL